MISDDIIIAALAKVGVTYGRETAVIVEQIFRTETKHFKSGNFIATLSPGMEATNDFSPYGWNKCNEFWINNPHYHPVGIFKQVDNDSALSKSKGERKFIRFDAIEDSMMTVADIVNKAGNNGGVWNSNDLAIQKKYSDFLTSVKPRFVNSLINLT